MNATPTSATVMNLASLSEKRRKAVYFRRFIAEQMAEAKPGKITATARKIASANGISVRSVEKWSHSYKRHGLQGLIDHRLSDNA